MSDIVQKSTKTQAVNSSSIPCALTGVTAGNTLIYVAAFTQSSANGPVPTDSAGQTWTQAVFSAGNGTVGIAIWYLLSANAGAHTVTWAPTGGTWGEMQLIETVPMASFHLAGSVASASSSTTTSAPSLTTTAASAFILALLSVYYGSGNTALAITTPSGYTAIDGTNDDTTAPAGNWCYIDQPSAGASGAATWTYSGTDTGQTTYGVQVAFIKAATGPQTYNVGVTESGSASDALGATGGSVLSVTEIGASSDVVADNSKLLEFIASTSGGDTSFGSASIVATVPTGDAIGMLEIICFSTAVVAPATAPTHTTPSGFTALGTVTGAANGTALNERVSVFGRIVTAAPASITLTGSAVSALTYVRACYANPAATYFGQITLSHFASTTSVAVSSITTTKANANVTIFLGQAAAQGFTPPSGFTARLTNSTNGVGLMDETMVTAGAVGSKTVTLPAAADGFWAILELWPLVSGTIYFAADNESGAASDTPSATFSVGVAQAESGAASDSTSTGGGSTYPVTASEAGTAADVASGSFSTTQATTESGAASDTNAAAMIAAQAVAESGTVADATSESLGTTQTVAESGAASDVPNDQLAATAATAETGAATDSTDRLLLTPAAALEVGAATDASGAAQVTSQVVAESGAAADVAGGVETTAAIVAESGTAADIEGVLAGGFVAIAEVGATSDSASAAMTTPQSVAEAGATVDYSAGSLVRSAASVEAGAASDSATSGSVSGQVLVETGAASDAVSGATGTGLSVVESGAVADAVSALAAGVLLVSDAGAAADTPASSAVFAPALADSGTAADTPGASRTTATGLTESGASLDATDAQVAMSGAIAEVGTAADLVGGFVAFVSAIFDALVAQEEASTAGIADLSVNEAGAAADTGSAGISFSEDMAEGLTASEVLTLFFLLWAHTGGGDVWYVDARATAVSDEGRTTVTSIDHRNTAA